jgi:pilus assembly protein CpaB
VALRRAQKIVFREEENEIEAPDGLLAEPDSPTVEPESAPLLLDRRDGVERRQAERRGLESLRTEYQRSLLASAEEPNENYRPSLALPFGLKPSRLALILVAVLAGGIAAYLAMNREPTPPQVAAAPVEVVAAPMPQILVAKSNLAVGQRLTPDMVEWQDWPDTAMRPGYISNSSNPDAAKEMAGRMVRATVYAGEPIRTEKLAAPGGGLLSSILDKGMRGVSVQINAESASGGFVLPDDRVDVVLTHGTPDGRQELETILRNVRVLAINANLGAPDGSAQTADASGKGFSDQAIATLELNDIQSEVIIKASTMGKLSLTLRSTADTPSAQTAEEQAANAAIRISSPFWAQ